MSESRESQWSQSEAHHDPTQRREHYESQIKRASSLEDTEPEFEPQFDAGEMDDVVEDDKQEPEEDGTASEEELARWAKSNAPEDAPEPGSASAKPITQPTIVQPHEQVTDSDIIETAGETGDVVSDATQSGRDRFAAKAEEKSLDKDAAKDSGIRPA